MSGDRCAVRHWYSAPDRRHVTWGCRRGTPRRPRLHSHGNQLDRRFRFSHFSAASVGLPNPSVTAGADETRLHPRSGRTVPAA
jgi:hypothetical protein